MCQGKDSENRSGKIKEAAREAQTVRHGVTIASKVCREVIFASEITKTGPKEHKVGKIGWIFLVDFNFG
jgi:hypothetical protein